MNVSAHQFVNVKTLTIKKARQGRFLFSGLLNQTIDKERTGVQLLRD